MMQATKTARPNVRREDVAFVSGGQRIAGWFYPGEGVTHGQRPCIVMGHGFAGVKEARLDAFADRFAAAGFACLVFDYRHFGASEGEPRQLIDLNRQRADWDAAIAYAGRCEGVDPERIALWGTSLGGGLVLELARKRRDVRCAVAQAPLVDALATSAGEARWHTLKMTLAAIRDLAAMALRRRPYLIPVVGPYGTLAFMTAPEAAPGYFSIVGNAPSWRNLTTARTAAQLAYFRPARHAGRIACPLLVVTGDRDQITPALVTHRALRRVRDATYVSYEGGHFDGYMGAGFEVSVEAAVAFFRRTLEAPPAARSEPPPRVATPSY
jgi:dienelactone hydrolase